MGLRATGSGNDVQRYVISTGDDGAPAKKIMTFDAKIFIESGRRGGTKTQASRTPAQRTKAARKAARARWNKPKAVKTS